MVGLGKILYTLYFANVTTIMLIAVTFFILSVRSAYRIWKNHQRRSEESFANSANLGHQIAAEFCYQVLKTTMRLSLTAFIYVISISPLFAVNMYKLYVGFVEQKGVREFFNMYPSISISVIGAMNIISYGYLSPMFRHEIAVMIKRRLGKISQPRRFESTVNETELNKTKISKTNLFNSRARDHNVFSPEARSINE